jgi:hypothetical protein
LWWLPSLPIILILVVLAAARQTEVVESVFRVGGQEFRVIPAYAGQARYLEEVEPDPGADAASIWRERVVVASREDCAWRATTRVRPRVASSNPDAISGVSKARWMICEAPTRHG